jgi:hypothetical protein
MSGQDRATLRVLRVFVMHRRDYNPLRRCEKCTLGDEQVEVVARLQLRAQNIDAMVKAVKRAVRRLRPEDAAVADTVKSEIKLGGELDQTRIHDARRGQPAASVGRCDELRIVRVQQVGKIHAQIYASPTHLEKLRDS